MTALSKVQHALERTDGCAQRGSPDGPGAGRDWIIDCVAQQEASSFLRAALSAMLN